MGISAQVLSEIADGNHDLDRLAAVTGHPRKALVKAVQVLKKRGYVRTRTGRSAETGGLAPGVYVLTDSGRLAAESGEAIAPGKTGERPRKQTAGLRERIWWHLHTHRVATLTELLNTHARGDEKAAHVNVYKYLVGLERAGVIVRLEKRQPARQSRGRVVWTRVVDLGPKAPVVRPRAREVYDPNADQVLPMKEMMEAGDDARV